ncbi:hypothetical protein ABNF65_07975 [Paenibacillus larvae]
MSNPQIENNFKYHAPKPEQVEKYTALREKAKELAYLIDDLCPNSREKSLALTNLEQSIMWANASIARNLTFAGKTFLTSKYDEYGR